MKHRILESFQWFVPDYRINKGAGNKIIIKGRALFAGTVSRNLRRYVKEELVRAARTLIGKPITINHNPNRIVGHIIDAEEEDNAIEYVGEINKREYVQKLLDRKAMEPESYYKKWLSHPINGVSVEADYRKNRCVECGEEFYDHEAFITHMNEMHGIKNFKVEPRGIIMKALSLVEPPEQPGVPGTTIELMEKAEGMSRLMETLTTDLKQEIRMKKEKDKLKDSGVAISSEKHVTPTIGEQEDTTGQAPAQQEELPERKHECGQGSHWDKEAGTCVPDSITAEPGKAVEAEYPWDNCVADRKADGYTEEQAKKICAAIKNRTIKHTMEWENKTFKEAMSRIIDKCSRDKLFNYTLSRIVEQMETPTTPSQTVKAPTHCPLGFEPDGAGGCKPVEQHEVTPPKEAPKPVAEPTITIPKVDVATPAPAQSTGPVKEQEEGQLPPEPKPAPPADISKQCDKGSHWDKEAGTCVPDVVPAVGQTQTKPLAEIRLPSKLSLAEPCDWSKAGYTSFEDCVSKNQDKADPEAYCADVKRKLGGETLYEIADLNRGFIRDLKAREDLNKLAKSTNLLIDSTALLTKELLNLPANLHRQILTESKLRSRSDKQYYMLTTDYMRKVGEAIIHEIQGTSKQLLSYTNKKLSQLATDNAGLRRDLGKTINAAVEMQKKLDSLEAKLGDVKTYGEALEELKKRYEAFVKEQEEKPPSENCGPGTHWDKEQQKCVPDKPPEVEETKKKLVEMATKIENLEHKLQGRFKGKSKPLDKGEGGGLLP